MEPCASDASCGRGLRCQPDPSTGVAVCTLDVGYIDEFFRDYRSPEE
ncbi:MAG: hypothetical protein KC933_18085 [Myxococcales bacterium]|nr:hypothetical protein [Myxococcales bacterium]